MSRFHVRTVWGPSGAQKALFRRPDQVAPLPEQMRQQSGKYLGASSYGVAVPICIGRARVPAILIEKHETGDRVVYLICEGEQQNLGRVSFNDKDAVPFEVDPASFVPGTTTQTTNGATKIPYRGRMVSWRDHNPDDEVLSLSYEVNGGPSDALQETTLHDAGATGIHVPPLNYQAETFVRGTETHLVYVLKTGTTEWSILHRKSTDGGFVWSSATTVATVAHPTPAPVVFGDQTSNVVHLAWFHLRGTTVEIREAFSAGGAFTVRTVHTLTTATRSGLDGASHLNGSAAGGRVWLAWQCHPHPADTNPVNNGSRGVDLACCTAPTDSAATWAHPQSIALTRVTQQLRVDKYETDFYWDIRIPSISARANGSALLAFHVRHRGIMVLPVVLNGTQVEWDPAVYASNTDPCGLAAAVYKNGPVIPTTWANGEDESLIRGKPSKNWPYETRILPSHGLPPLPVPASEGSTGYKLWGYPSAIIRLLEIPGNRYMLIYCPGPTLSGNFGASTRWKLHIAPIGSTTPETALEFPLDTFLHCAPRVAYANGQYILTACRAQVLGAPESDTLRGWNGDVQAWRWTWGDLGGLVDAGHKVVLVSGSDDVVHAVLPTPNGMVMQQWGDFEPGDASTGNRSRLIAWDPTVTDSGDVDPCGVIVRELLSERHLGPVWRPENNDFTQILKNVEETDKYTQAMGFEFSDSITSQVNSWQHLCDVMASANCVPVWSEGKLEWVPVEHHSIVGNGVSWSPQESRQTPVYDLTPADWLAGSIPSPSSCDASAQKTVMPISYTDRAQNYRTVTLDMRDASGVVSRGDQKAAAVDRPWIHRSGMAALSAWCTLRRERLAPRSWEVKLTARHQMLTPMDLVTLTDERVGLGGEWYRVQRITRHSNLTMTVVFEYAGADFGVPVSPITDDETGPVAVTYAPSIVDGAVVALPETFRNDGFQRVLLAACGPVGWQGCDVWRRWNGGEWGKIGTLSSGSPIGALILPMDDLVPRETFQPRADLMPGLADAWTANFAVSREAIPASSSTAWMLGVPPALAIVGDELMSHADRTNFPSHLSSGESLRRGLWGAEIVDHLPGEKVAVFGGNHMEWTPDGEGLLEVRFPSLAVPGSLAEPLEAARSFFLEVP